jgi:hypothetical protein
MKFYTNDIQRTSPLRRSCDHCGNDIQPYEPHISARKRVGTLRRRIVAGDVVPQAYFHLGCWPKARDEQARLEL